MRGMPHLVRLIRASIANALSACFSQTAIARLGETPEMFERLERVLNLGPHTRFFMIGLFVSIGQWTIPVRMLIGKVPRVGCDSFEKPPLILAPVSTIAVESSFITVQEVWQLLVSCTLPGVTLTLCISPV